MDNFYKLYTYVENLITERGVRVADPVLLVERHGAHVLHVRLNRPERRNAINAEIAAAMEAAVDEAESDRTIRAVVLSAAGEQSFSAGADLNEVAGGRGKLLVTERGGFAGLIQAKRMKPWIAAVEAPALGGGLEICLACDMVIASEKASFGLPEVKRGILAAAGGMFRLARRIAPVVAYEMLTSGDPIDAQRAFTLGLVNKVVAAGAAESAALDLAARIAENAPLSVQQSLHVARQAQDLGEAALFDAMRAASKIVISSEDAKEGPRAFLEKRKPQWSAQ